MFSKVANFLGDFRTIGVSAAFVVGCQVLSQIPHAKRVQQVALLTMGVGLVANVIRGMTSTNPPAVIPDGQGRGNPAPVDKNFGVAVPLPRAPSGIKQPRFDRPGSATPAPQPVTSNRPVREAEVSVKPETTITLKLIKARQYDRKNAPPACTFHALEAMDTFGKHFEVNSGYIEQRFSEVVSNLQNNIINRGLKRYEKGSFEQGADLEHIRKAGLVPSTVKLEKSEDDCFGVDSATLEPNLKRIKEHVFLNGLQNANVCWLKNQSEESFALIGKNSQVVVFDSHKNEISLIRHMRELDRILREKLTPNGVNDVNVFEFALGTIL